MIGTTGNESVLTHGTVANDCAHSQAAIHDSVIVDGLCPLCLRRKLAHANNTIERLENELRDCRARMLDYADRNALLLLFGERMADDGEPSKAAERNAREDVEDI